ncbi:hypothetical protein CEXT_292101 [Caerostris extrusa]|uniref:Ribosomal protein L32 n=1 Tax=Caerostris extrusa TaxID=172846 RepID=A0AAV4SMA7_CAEEX|nr:hypothetical protein CEXT_292101 [Caerostris extrusa]
MKVKSSMDQLFFKNRFKEKWHGSKSILFIILCRVVYVFEVHRHNLYEIISEFANSEFGRKKKQKMRKLNFYQGKKYFLNISRN